MSGYLNPKADDKFIVALSQYRLCPGLFITILPTNLIPHHQPTAAAAAAAATAAALRRSRLPGGANGG